MFRAVTRLAIALTLFAVSRSDNSTSPSAMSLLYKTIASCADGNTLNCLRKRTVVLLDKASSMDNLPLWGDTLALVKSSPENTKTTEFSTERSVGESFTYLLDSHRIQLRLPRLSYFLPLSEVTGRGKKNKGGYGILAMTIIGAMLAMGMAGLAAMAGKALAASMAALMMAAMAALKKGGGGGGHGGHSSYEVISIPPHHHRSFLEEQQMNNPYRYDSEPHEHHEK